MLLLTISLLLVSLGSGEDLKKMYKDAVIHYKDPEFESGETRRPKDETIALIKDQKHYNAFKKHVKEVEKHNKEDGEEWIAEINELSLETDDEFLKHLGFNKSMSEEEEDDEGGVNLVSLVRRDADRSEVEELEGLEQDWTSFLPPVKNQKSCGSCWAFAAMPPLEFHVNRNRRAGSGLVSLSEQQCMDCRGSNACFGGCPDSCWRVGVYYGHWASDHDYVYEAQSETPCRFAEHKNAMPGLKLTIERRPMEDREGWYRYEDYEALDGTADNILVAINNPEKYGVLAAALYAGSAFASYKSGVFSDPYCTDNMDTIGTNHAVDIVGYGKLNGIPYWRVRNSWGATWGDGGYINMKRGVGGETLNTCNVLSYVRVPNIKVEATDIDSEVGTTRTTPITECADLETRQRDYRGTVSTTKSGKECQAWGDQQNPHWISETTSSHPGWGLEENYCRNPQTRSGDRDRVWCYTKDSSVATEECDIPECSPEKWCETRGEAYSEELPGAAQHTDITQAKSACNSNSECLGVESAADGTYRLMTGLLLQSSEGKVTHSKGVCEQFLPEVTSTGEEWCKILNYTTVSSDNKYRTLQQAMKSCLTRSDCIGFGPMDVDSAGHGFGIYVSTSGTKLYEKPGKWYYAKKVEGHCPAPFSEACVKREYGFYRGYVNVTLSGRPCDPWDNEENTSITYITRYYPDSPLDGNYCRNPRGSSRAWCYYKKEFSWGNRYYKENCDVPACPY